MLFRSGLTVAGQSVVSTTAAAQVTDLSPYSGEFILGWVEFDGAVEVGQRLVMAPHRQVGPAATENGPGLVGVESDSPVEVVQGVLIAPIAR